MPHERMENTYLKDAVFLGNGLDFSDINLRLAMLEIEGLNCPRVSAMNDLFFMSRERADQVRLIIVNETRINELETNIRRLREHFPKSHFAIAYRNTQLALGFLQDARMNLELSNIGFLPMGMEINRWLSILRLLIYGETYIPSELLRSLPTQAESRIENTVPAPSVEVEDLGEVLTDREQQVLYSISAGKQNKIIAADLSLSEHTVKLHVHNIMAKLGVNNRTEAAIRYIACRDKEVSRVV
jgi:DNA-binding NarL/FixJ family response regulator